MAILLNNTTYDGTRAHHDGVLGDTFGIDADTLDGKEALDYLDSNQVKYSKLLSPMFHCLGKGQLLLKSANTLTVERATSATFININGLIETAPIDELRREKDGWLFEGQSTNLCPTSDLNTYTKQGVVVEANTTETTAPDGTNTAFKVTSTGTTYHRVYGGSSAGTGFHTNSVFVKAGTFNAPVVICFAGLSGGGYADLIFNPSNGQIISTAADSGTPPTYLIEELANDWYRISVTTNLPVAGNYFDFRLNNRAGNVAGEFCYIWGPQTEAMPFMTSYIPPTGSPTTRVADNVYAVFEGNCPDLTGRKSQLSIFCNFKSKIGVSPNYTEGLKGLYQSLFGVSNDINIFNYNMVRINSSISDMKFYRNGTGISKPLTSDSSVAKHSVCATLDGDEIQLYFDGKLAASGTQVPHTNEGNPNLLKIGSNFGSATSIGEPFYGLLEDFRIYDYVLSGSEISLLNSYGLGKSTETPAKNAQEILADDPTASNGIYWIEVNGTPQMVYCDMKAGGFMLLATFSSDTIYNEKSYPAIYGNNILAPDVIAGVYPQLSLTGTGGISYDDGTNRNAYQSYTRKTGTLGFFSGSAGVAILGVDALPGLGDTVLTEAKIHWSSALPDPDINDLTNQGNMSNASVVINNVLGQGTPPDYKDKEIVDIVPFDYNGTSPIVGVSDERTGTSGGIVQISHIFIR